MGKMKDIDLNFKEHDRQFNSIFKLLVQQEIRLQDVEHSVHTLSRMVSEIDTAIEKRFRNK